MFFFYRRTRKKRKRMQCARRKRNSCLRTFRSARNSRVFARFAPARRMLQIKIFEKRTRVCAAKIIEVTLFGTGYKGADKDIIT